MKAPTDVSAGQGLLKHWVAGEGFDLRNSRDGFTVQLRRFADVQGRSDTGNFLTIPHTLAADGYRAFDEGPKLEPV
jgi:hypothetical protein